MVLKITRLMLHSINTRKLWLFFFFSLFFVLTAEATEYIVSPAPGDEFGVSWAGEEVTEARVFSVYWQFLLWLALMQILSVVDMLILPAKFLFAILGFRVSDHSNAVGALKRKFIFSFIKVNPGTCPSEIANNLEINRGTLRYHLNVLEEKNLIEAHIDHGNVRYFQNNFTYGENEKLVISSLQNEMSRNIILNILYRECNTNGDLARKIGISRAAMNWHVTKLKDSGLIEEYKAGRSMIYSINPVYRDLIERSYMKFFESRFN
ncbi:Transcriptional regulator, ArsR family [Methanosarcina siciliae C2J]|uniref:Transcriptional regulator, ArsR family n=1 Tax=Methanosarcina siciliae C2J TaxID=1434118 RepID=A0A0E3PPI6_9EURY|nr:Transcriptional regulator, ArsR family [Methanosarcina siciliae C2J]